MQVLTDAIGNTPLIKLEKLSDETGLDVWVKFEAANPGGSIKDRAALMMVDCAEQAGTIVPGETILIEPTSGNTGIALAMIGAARGYQVTLVMPESMSVERQALFRMYGANIELTSAAGGMAEAVEKAETLVKEAENAWLVGQFFNPNNPKAHRKHTGPEIERSLGKAPDYVIAGVGTGATISGVAHYFKARQNNASSNAKECVEEGDVRFYAVEPAESPLISQGLSGTPLEPARHGIQGIGANFIPKNLDLSILDGAVPVSTQEALEQARWLANEEGVLAGISSGANIAAIRRFAVEHPEAHGACVVSFAVDTGERYVSTALFD